MRNEQEWPGEWLRAVLPQAVLRVLESGPTYGYAIAACLGEAGFGVIKGGTLYPLLGRLETAEHVSVEWRPGDGGPGRKYYAITSSGRDYLRQHLQHWTDFSKTVNNHLDSAGSETTHGR